MTKIPFQLVIGLGSNLGDREKNIFQARDLLDKRFGLKFCSSIYESDAIEYTNQPSFLNAVAEFSLPLLTAKATLEIMLEIEKKMGRKRDIPKGPRIIDLDLLFYGISHFNEPQLCVPHPEWNKRVFVYQPLCELFPDLKNYYTPPPNDCNCRTYIQRIEDGIST